MCGIAGLISVGTGPLDPGLVRRMTAALAHRGPDGEGWWTDGEAALGHRRLAIIDLAGGAQPLENETGSVRVVCNGEIYNYRELRVALEARGHRFRTASDCETIVHLYEEHGPDAVARLNGMFALAIWDRTLERLVLDPRGLRRRPYWTLEPGAPLRSRTAAAEELRALLTAAVREHLVSDVPVGVFLSGGIDSSVVSTLAAASAGPLSTFSVTFPED